jgi:hypothetical protein
MSGDSPAAQPTVPAMELWLRSATTAYQGVLVIQPRAAGAGRRRTRDRLLLLALVAVAVLVL